MSHFCVSFFPLKNGFQHETVHFLFEKKTTEKRVLFVCEFIHSSSITTWSFAQSRRSAGAHPSNLRAKAIMKWKYEGHCECYFLCVSFYFKIPKSTAHQQWWEEATQEKDFPRKLSTRQTAKMVLASQPACMLADRRDQVIATADGSRYELASRVRLSQFEAAAAFWEKGGGKRRSAASWPALTAPQARQLPTHARAGIALTSSGTELCLCCPA